MITLLTGQRVVDKHNSRTFSNRFKAGEAGDIFVPARHGDDEGKQGCNLTRQKRQHRLRRRMRAWTSKFCTFCIYGVLLRWFIKVKPYLRTELPKGLNCASQKYFKSCVRGKKYSWPVLQYTSVIARAKRCFKLDTTSTQGLTANFNMLFFLMTCSRFIDATVPTVHFICFEFWSDPSGGPWTWSTGWSLDSGPRTRVSVGPCLFSASARLPSFVHFMHVAVSSKVKISVGFFFPSSDGFSFGCFTINDGQSLSLSKHRSKWAESTRNTEEWWAL